MSSNITFGIGQFAILEKILKATFLEEYVKFEMDIFKNKYDVFIRNLSSFESSKLEQLFFFFGVKSLKMITNNTTDDVVTGVKEPDVRDYYRTIIDSPLSVKKTALKVLVDVEKWEYDFSCNNFGHNVDFKYSFVLDLVIRIRNKVAHHGGKSLDIELKRLQLFNKESLENMLSELYNISVSHELLIDQNTTVYLLANAVSWLNVLSSMNDDYFEVLSLTEDS